MGIKEYIIIALLLGYIGVYFYGHSNGVDDCRNTQTSAALTMTTGSEQKIIATGNTYDPIIAQVQTSPLYGKSDPKCPVAPIIRLAISKLPNQPDARR